MNTTTVVNILNTSVSVTVTSQASAIDAFISSLANSSQRLVIGLDYEWNSNEPNAKAATLQLCHNAKCIIIQMLYLDYIPQSLVNFLANPNFTFVGVGINKDIEKLKKQYGLGCGNYAELGHLAARRYAVSDRNSLKSLAWEVLGARIEKNDSVIRSMWNASILSMDQIAYAATDAHVSYLLGAGITV